MTYRKEEVICRHTMNCVKDRKKAVADVHPYSPLSVPLRVKTDGPKDVKDVQWLWWWYRCL